MAGFGPPPSNGTGNDNLNKQQLIAYYGIDPTSLTEEEFKQTLALIKLSQSTGLPFQQLLQAEGLQEAGIATPTLLQKLLGLDDRTGGGSDPAQIALGYARLSSEEKIAFAQIAAQLRNTGMDAESARQQALATLIANRNAQQVNLAGTYGDIAAQAAKFASAPEDTYADLLYRNAVGGATPFGAMSANPEAANARKTALEAKFQELFGPAAAALSRAGEFISSPPPAEFYGPELRAALDLPATSAQSLAGAGGGAGAAAPATAAAPAAFPNIAAGLGALPAGALQQPKIDLSKLKGLAMGGTVAAADEPGFTPASSEGGTNLNIHEPALVIGRDSGHVYATLAEPRPDGTRRGEQLIIKPLPSEQEKDKKMKEAGKKFVQSATETLKGFAEGGAINAIPDFSDLFRETRKLLGNIGGVYGGIGEAGKAGTLPDVRLLAGAPYEELVSDPHLLAQVMAGYRTAEGGAINPQTFLSMIKKFTPSAPSYNTPRVSFA